MQLNTVNRFTELAVDLDPEEISEDDRRVRTRYLDDTSRSVISTNSSPDLGFDASINPYRGCEHGCSYCLDGSTAILLADGSTIPLREVKVGDAIAGTVRVGHYRRLAVTTVHDAWMTVKPSYMVTLADGTQLIASGDHRFLTERGWKHVVNHPSREFQRPHLSTGNHLMGWGTYGSRLGEDSDYIQGYLSGIIRGDGHLGTSRYRRVGRTHGNQYRFRLAMKDHEALDRASAYLARCSVHTSRFTSAEPSGARAGIDAIRTSRQADIQMISSIIGQPSTRTPSWSRGFLAGFYDAEGSLHGATMRFSNTDTSLISLAATTLNEFGFEYVIEPPKRGTNRPVHSLRVLGGARSVLRFAATINPAIVRKRTLLGMALKSDRDLRVVSIEPYCDAQELYDITTGTGDFIANGVVSHNCYARPTHEYLGLSAGLDFERVIMVKRDAAALLEAKLRSRSWKPRVLMLSGVTDPYQPIERRLRITRSALEVLARFRNPVSLITKNALVTRDLDILAEMASWSGAVVTVSITTLDESLRARLEPRTSTIAERFRAMRELAAAGVPVGVNMAPIIPGLTDHEVNDLLAAAAEAGASHARYTLLRLPGAVTDLFTQWLDDNAPLRKDKVLNRVAEVHGGVLDDRRFGRRMRGEGVYATQLGDLFRLARRRAGIPERGGSLDASSFRVPGEVRQGSLFGEGVE